MALTIQQMILRAALLVGFIHILSISAAAAPSSSPSSYHSGLLGSTLAPRSETEQQTIDVYKRVNDAVVNISTRAEMLDLFGTSHQEGSGSGVIVDGKAGYIITNFHVVNDAQEISVALASGQTYQVKVVGQDADNEIALLQIVAPPTNLVAAELGDSSQLEVGQRVLAIGNPFGLNRTLTAGLISSLGRTIRSEAGGLIEDVVQTDAAINPGNSGGPLLDMAGRVVGLNTAIYSRTGESAGIGFAIPINAIKNVLPQLISYGRVLRPKIGVIFIDTEAGPALLYVQGGSPADQAGLTGARRSFKRGALTGVVTDFDNADFILEINSKPVKSKNEAMSAISRSEPNKVIEIVARRGIGANRIRTVTVKPVLN